MALGLLEVGGVDRRVNDLERLVDVVDARGGIAVGIGDDKLGVLLAHVAHQGPHGGGGHLLIAAYGKLVEGQRAQVGQGQHGFCDRRLGTGASHGALVVGADECPGLGVQGAGGEGADNVIAFEGIAGVEVVGLGTALVNTGPL